MKIDLENDLETLMADNRQLGNRSPSMTADHGISNTTYEQSLDISFKVLTSMLSKAALMIYIVMFSVLNKK